MASIERRSGRRRDAGGRRRNVVRYRVRYRDARGAQHSETLTRFVDAERRRSEIEHELSTSTWHDRRRGNLLLRDWVAGWLPTRHDLRATTWVRLEVTINRQVLPGSATCRSTM